MYNNAVSLVKPIYELDPDSQKGQIVMLNFITVGLILALLSAVLYANSASAYYPVSEPDYDYR